MNQATTQNVGAKRCLMVVESPSKCKTLKKFLGSSFDVMASYGHVRDLSKGNKAVNPDEGFAANYVDIERNIKHMNAIASKMRKANVLYLATDPDREGEAIAGHVAEILNEKNLLNDKVVYRVSFNEISESAVKDAIQNPRQLDASLIEAQRARRILDCLVGFNLSPLLWKKVHSGLSAGRVQSPALRMIVEREEEIRRFVVEEYWTIDALCAHNKEELRAKLVRYAGKKVEKFSFGNETDAMAAVERIKQDSAGKVRVGERTVSTRQLRPPPPYITSTLLQDASNRLGFDQRRTMSVAQRLYEGISVGGTQTSLITYMRTDSTRLSTQAIGHIRSLIKRSYSDKHLPNAPRYYKSKSKNSQEAHEAIRPNDPSLLPSRLNGLIGGDELRLYTLVWARAIASQMTNAVSETNRIKLLAGQDHELQLTGSRIIFDGFMAVNEERQFAHKTRSKNAAGEVENLPDLPEGSVLALRQLLPEQHFTKPPPRYSVATLVEALENNGIGRPSTYATIVGILEQRGYVEVRERSFHPTDTGMVVNSFLVEHFKRYVDYDFTAQLEASLDNIANGDAKWQEFLHSFWIPFKDLVEDKSNSVKRGGNGTVRNLGEDPKSGLPVSVRIGRYGPFVQIGSREDEEKPRFASLPNGMRMDDIDLPGALSLFRLPRHLGHTEKGEDITVAIGRYGPYVQFGDRYATLDQDDDPYTIELDRAQILIARRIERDRERTVKSFDDEKIRVMRSRFGFTVVMGTKRANLPKEFDVDGLSREGCLELLKKNGNKGNGNGRKTGKSPSRPSTTKARKAAGRKTTTRKTAGRKTSTKATTTKKRTASATTKRATTPRKSASRGKAKIA